MVREDSNRSIQALPPGWMWTTLGDSCDVILGQSPPSETYNTDGIGLPFFQGKAEFGDLYPTVVKWCSQPGKIAEAGDVLVSIRAPVGPTNLCRERSCIGRGLAALRPPHGMPSLYLLYSLRHLEQDIAGKATGTTFPAIGGDVLRRQQIPLAPLPEQHRIVAVIEELFSDLDAGVAALKRVQANLKRYRASVLKAACEGRLVPTEAELAREEGRAYEPADVLLQRILAERRARWEAEHPGKKYVEPPGPQTDGLPELPAGWCWARAEQLCDFITKGTTPAAIKLFTRAGDVPFIKVYNLTDQGVLDFSVHPTFVGRPTHTGELARSRVYPGDVLMNIVGPPLGKVSIVPDLHPEWNVNQAIAIFRPMPGYDRRFLCYSLLTEHVLAWAIRRAKATAGQFNLTLEICRDLPLPVPPLAEQHHNVAEVERRLSVVAELEATVAANLARAGRLRQAVLKRAFEGRLV